MAQLNINVPDAQYQAFKAAAKRSGRSMREIVLAAIADHIARPLPSADVRRTLTPDAPAQVTEGRIKRAGTNPAPRTAKPVKFSPPGQGTGPRPIGIPKSYSTR